MKRLSGGAGAVLLLAVFTGAQEDRAFALAEASAEAAATDGTLSLLLARAAFEAGDVEPARTALYAALASARERAILKGHQGAVVHVDLSADGSTVATASEDGTARLWAADGKEMASIAAGVPVREVRFLGENVLVVTATEIAIFSRDGQKAASFPPGPFDVMGSTLAITPGPGALRLVGESGKVLKDLKVKGSGPAGGEFTFWAVTADGKLRWYDGKGIEKLVAPAAGASRAVFKGPIVASFGTGIAVELWSPQCKKLGKLVHAGPIEQVSISGDRIFTASADGHYAFWTADGKRQNRIEKPGPCLFAEVSEDGQRVVTLDDTDRVTVWTWDAVPASNRFPGIARVVPNRRGLGLILEFKDGSRRFVTARLEEVKSGDLLGGALTFARWADPWLLVADDAGAAALQHWYGAGPGYLRGHSGAIVHAAVSADGALVATASRDFTARVWFVDPPAVATFHHPAKVTGIGYEPGRILTCSRDTLHLRAADGGAVRDLPFPSPIVWWSHGQGRVAVAHQDELAAVLYDLDGKELNRLKHEGIVNGVEIAPKGDLAVTFSADKLARLWDARGGKRGLLEHPAAVKSAAVSDDGSLVLTTAADRQARVWSADGKLQATFAVPEEIWYCNFSPTGKFIVGIPTNAHVAPLWTSAGEEVGGLRGHEGPIRNATFSQEDDAVVTASADGTARVFDTKARMDMILSHPDVVYKAVFVPGGAGIVTACGDGAARHFGRDGRLLAVMRGHARPVWFAECSRDGLFVATGSEDTTVRLWPLRHDDLLRLAKERSIRGFTPEERDRYGDLLGPG